MYLSIYLSIYPQLKAVSFLTQRSRFEVEVASQPSLHLTINDDIQQNPREIGNHMKGY